MIDDLGCGGKANTVIYQPAADLADEIRTMANLDERFLV